MRREPLVKHAEPVRHRGAHRGKHRKAMAELSRQLRANHPVCQVCAARPSTEVHHRVKWTDSVAKRLDRANLVVCCRSCHEQLERQGG